MILIVIIPPRGLETKHLQMKVICTTCCHRDDQAMVRTTAKLFSAAVSESVDPNTSHVVMGTPKRTINLLKAIINGAYVLSLDWVSFNFYFEIK